MVGAAVVAVEEGWVSGREEGMEEGEPHAAQEESERTEKAA